MRNALSAIALSALTACGGGGGDPEVPSIPTAPLPIEYTLGTSVLTPASAMVLGVMNIDLEGPDVFVPSNAQRTHMFLTIDHHQKANVMGFEVLELRFDVIDQTTGDVLYTGNEPRVSGGLYTDAHLYYGPFIDLKPGDHKIKIRLTVKAYDQGGKRQIASLDEARTTADCIITVN